MKEKLITAFAVVFLVCMFALVFKMQLHFMEAGF
jgi:hypothetical protein